MTYQVTSSMLCFNHVNHSLHVDTNRSLDLVDQLLARDSALLQVGETTKHILKTLTDLRPVNLDLAISEQLLAQVPEHDAKLKVLWLSWELGRAELKGLADNSVAERVAGLDVFAGVLCRQEEGDDAALAGDGLGGDCG